MKVLMSICLCLLLVSSVTAMTVSFYYSETCPHCQAIYPKVMNLVNQQSPVSWGVYEVSTNPDNQIAVQEAGFVGVPAFVIETDDKRLIKFTGANYPKLVCELNEMSVKECPTYSADECKTESWFK